jgi:hypothetical protein
MEHHNLKFLVSVVLAQVACTAFGSTDTLTELYLRKSYWEKMQWNQAESSKLWTLNGWQPFDGKQDDKNTFVKTREITLFGKDFKSQLAFENNKPQFQHFISLFADGVSRNDCERIAKEFTSRFGQPRFSDGTIAFYFSDNNYVKLVNLSYQWDIGSTRINSTCMGSVRTEEDVNVNVPKLTWVTSYSHKSKTALLVPNFLLRCSRQFIFLSGSRGSSDAGELIMWVDTNNSLIKNIDHSSISDQKTFFANDNEIKFKITRKDTISDYTINRITGSLSANVMQGSNDIAKITGKCEKSDKLEKKF